MKRRGFTLIELIAVLVIIAILAAIIWPVLQRANHPHDRPKCQSNLKQMALALLMYSQDYTDQFPLIRVNDVAESLAPYDKPFGWADAIYPYLKNTQLLQCGTDEIPINARQDATLGNFTDYYCNTNLAGLPNKRIIYPAGTFLFGDGNDGTDGSDARYTRNMLPTAWRKPENSPARRHLDGANYAFADGHVKWLAPKNVKAVRTRENDFSFAVK